jgi:hypothetical protein
VLAGPVTTLSPLTLSPELIARARQIMDDDPYIHPVIGDSYEVLRIDPHSTSENEPQGASFAIKMPEAVTFPVGAPAWRGCGETGICDDGRLPGPTTLDQPLGPIRRFFITVSVTEGRVHAIFPIPDELAVPGAPYADPPRTTT